MSASDPTSKIDQSQDEGNSPGRKLIITGEHAEESVQTAATAVPITLEMAASISDTWSSRREESAPPPALTFGLAAPPSVPRTAGGAWVTPVLQMPESVPHMWIPTQRESRFRASRKRLEQIMDKLIDGTQSSRPPKTVVVVAHPDDEAIGVGARLKSLPDALIVHVTDGAPRDPIYAQKKGFATREEYARARQDELLAALTLVGVGPDRTRCLNVVDGEATERLVELAYAMADLLDEVRPEVVLTHPYEGGHTDHDATAFAVHLACGLLRREGLKPPALLEMTSYYRRESRRVVHDFLPHKRADKGQRTVHLDQEQQERKREMYDCFATQRQVLRTFATEMEKFRPAPRYNFTRPPHEGQLNYERFGEPYRGHRWRRDAEEALARLS